MVVVLFFFSFFSSSFSSSPSSSFCYFTLYTLEGVVREENNRKTTRRTDSSSRPSRSDGGEKRPSLSRTVANGLRDADLRTAVWNDRYRERRCFGVSWNRRVYRLPVMLGNDVDEATFLFSKFAITDIPRGICGEFFHLSVVFTFAYFFSLFFQIESNLFYAFLERKNVDRTTNWTIIPTWIITLTPRAEGIAPTTFHFMIFTSQLKISKIAE